MVSRNSLDGCDTLVSPSEFDPRIIQPVASRYIDYAIPADMWAIVRVYLSISVLVRRHFSQLLMEYPIRHKDNTVLE